MPNSRDFCEDLKRKYMKSAKNSVWHIKGTWQILATIVILTILLGALDMPDLK